MHTARNTKTDISFTLSATEAGRQFGYTNDYVTRLAREKKILATRVGRQWYVDPQSLEVFVAKAEESKKVHAQKIRLERKHENIQVRLGGGETISVFPMPSTRAPALTKAGLVMCAGCVLGAFFFTLSQSPFPARYALASSAGAFDAIKEMATRIFNVAFFEHTTVEQEVSTRPVVEAVVSENKVHTENGTTTGMVVLPTDTPISLEEVAESFSDQVIVEKDLDGKSGVITPHFKSGTSTPYRFLLVPMNPP